MSLLYKREDNGEVIEMPDDTWLSQDCMGYVELEDGTRARRCVALEEQRKNKQKAKPRMRWEGQTVVSDSLGFGMHQLAEMEADRQMNGFSGIEFVQDKTEPTFYQVKCSSPQQYQRYIKHRGWVDKNGNLGLGAGNILSKHDIEAAEKLVRARYGNKSLDKSENPDQ